MANIEQLYKDPKIGLSGIRTFKQKLQERGINKSESEIKEELSAVEAYTVSKPVRKRQPRTRKVIVFQPFEQLQADLVFINNLNPQKNDGIQYLLNIIDVMTKYVWSIPLRDKKAETITKAFEPIIKEFLPEKIQTDKGSEFFNRTFLNMLKKYQVILFATESDKKASVVERFNRTLKQKINRYLIANVTDRYIDALPAIISNYNNTVHSTIKMKPVDAIKPENYEKLITNYYKGYNPKTTKPKYAKGDLVRIPVWKNPFSKESEGNWTVEAFIIDKVKNTNPPTYLLKDLMNEKIKGSFNESELQKVSKDILEKEFRIEKILRTRIRNGVKEGFVKWYGYPDKFNSWVEI